MLRTIIAIAGLAVAAAASADLHEDMVNLDRAYIPALVITNQPLSPTTRRSMERLREEWNGYRARYPKAPAGFTEASWTKADKVIESSIADAEASVKAGKPTVAHEALERVRDAQYALRRGESARYGVPAGQAEALQRQLDAQTQTLSDLTAALEREDRAEIAAKAVATKPAFSKLMQMFGDFAAVRGG